MNIGLGELTLSSPPRTWIVHETMALALESDLQTVIGKVVRKLGYGTSVLRRNSCPRLRSSCLDTGCLCTPVPYRSPLATPR